MFNNNVHYFIDNLLTNHQAVPDQRILQTSTGQIEVVLSLIDTMCQF